MSDSSSSSGIGLAGAVFLVFLILKLAEVGVVAEWSWLWVFSPLWIPLVIAAAIFIIVIALKFFAYIIDSIIGALNSRSRLKNMMRDNDHLPM